MDTVNKALVEVTETGLLISGELTRMILDSERKRGIRGAGSKKHRIQKKIVKRRLLQIVDEYIEEQICLNKNSKQ